MSLNGFLVKPSLFPIIITFFPAMYASIAAVEPVTITISVFEIEFMKLSLLGVTLVASSGDAGAAGRKNARRQEK